MAKPILIVEEFHPRNFTSYEAYKEALPLRDKFYEIIEEAEKVFDSARTNEELEEGLHALGFISVDDDE